DYRDAWFVGYTGGFVTAVWVGKDNNKPMKRVTGGGAPAGIWRDFMGQALPRLKVQAIPGGTYEPPPSSDPIGDLVDGIADAIGVGGPQPAPAAPGPQPKAPADDVPY
ncbi:MAG: penicillin-binding protein, partial [Phenylobacterium sp.]